jgi:hypothetical protein
MHVPDADAQLAEVMGLLDSRVPSAGPGSTVYDRVRDLIESRETLAVLAASRLHEIHRLTGRPCEACAKLAEDPGRANDRILIRVTAGGLAHHYVALAGHWDFFPPSAIGAANEHDGLGRLLTLHFAGTGETVLTDLTPTYKSFRRRGAWGRFFAFHQLANGDEILIERTAAEEYFVRPITTTARTQ